MKNLILSFILLFCVQSLKAEKYALVIAIGDYPAKTGWSTISSINDVPLIKQTLLNQDFKESNIEVLLNEQATYEGIKIAFNNLLLRISFNDIVVIHYSGHGQQIVDNNGEEIDGLDEALVPYDAWVKYTHNYKGENHFRDDELGNFVNQLRNILGTNGQLLMLLDSCHSGTATRGGKARGSAAIFAPDGWKANTTKITNSGSDMFETTKISDHAAPFVLISGASANELNYEYKGYGSLSFAFNSAMNDLGKLPTSFRQLFTKIEAKMNIISPNQTPTIEGDLEKLLFIDGSVKQQLYYNISNIARPNVIQIQAGKLHRLFKNTTVSVLPAGTLEATEDKIITKGIIVNAKFNKSVIKLDKPLTDFNKKNYWVFVEEPSYGDIAINVYFDKSMLDSKIKSGITQFLKTKNLGTIVADSLQADIVLLNKNNTITLNTPNGFGNIDADDSTRGSNSLEDINNKLFNFAQGQYLKNLSLKNYDYEFEFKLLPVEFDILLDEIGEELPEEDFINENGTFQVRPEKDYVLLEVSNKSKKSLYFSIIEINSKGEISPFLPGGNCTLSNDEDRKVQPGDSFVFKQCYWHFGPPYEKLTLKAFATSEPINFEFTVKTRGEAKRSKPNPLEKFLGNTYVQSRGSEGNKTGIKVDGYSTEFIYEIVKEKE